MCNCVSNISFQIAKIITTLLIIKSDEMLSSLSGKQSIKFTECLEESNFRGIN